jgi:hypothetical protein
MDVLSDVAITCSRHAPLATRASATGAASRIFSEPPAGLAALAPADLELLDAVLTRLAAPVADARVASGA